MALPTGALSAEYSTSVLLVVLNHSSIVPGPVVTWSAVGRDRSDDEPLNAAAVASENGPATPRVTLL